MLFGNEVLETCLNAGLTEGRAIRLNDIAEQLCDKPLRWTTAPPNRQGFWFIDAPGSRPCVVYVGLKPDGLSFDWGEDEVFIEGIEGWKWSDRPIKEPEAEDVV